MKNVILLDLDGVAIITPPWKQDEIGDDNFSLFNSSIVENLNDFFYSVDAEIWLISDRRKSFTLEQMNSLFKKRGLKKELSGLVSVYENGITRFEELNRFLQEKPIKNFLIIDDDASLENMAKEQKSFLVKTSPLIGFNQEKLIEAKNKIKNWKL
jgi:hypothetical protein